MSKDEGGLHVIDIEVILLLYGTYSPVTVALMVFVNRHASDPRPDITFRFNLSFIL